MVHTYIFIKSFVLVVILGLGILFLPESISISSFSNNTPSSGDITTEGSIDTNTSAESYGTGTAIGYGAAPFKINGGNTGYVGTDGFLYGAGYNALGEMGNSSSGSTYFKVYKQGSTSYGYFENPIDYHFGTASSIIVDNEGKVWTAGSTSYGAVSPGSTNYFGKAASIGSSSYKAVAASSGSFASLVLLDDGTLYGAGQSAGLSTAVSYSFTRQDGQGGLPAATASNPIVDFATGSYMSGVLYKNGDLYRLCNSSATRVATSITMFDLDSGAQTSSGYMYGVNTSNQVLYCDYSATSMSTILTNPSGTITQIRGSSRSYASWGYLNSAGQLYLSTSATTGNSPTGTPSLYTSNVKYFDLGQNANTGGLGFGMLSTSNVTTFWGTTTVGANGTPTLGGGVDHNYIGQSGLGQSTPPAFKSPN